ncbi:MAG: class I SAM-dependent methyltransferase [Syntrophobacteraceae bacterium]
MRVSSIDWNDLWRRTQGRKNNPVRDPRFWDKRAPEFTRHATAGDYVGQFISIMKPEPDWSVLDIGCAAGTLAVPMSPAVKSITAMDPSPVMLRLLDERCREQGIGNIRAVNGGWEDDWDLLGVEIHDVAISSRSLFVDDDLRKTVLKLQSYASKRVYISTMVDDGPHDRHIVEATGRRFRPGADYIIVYNLLRQMGICANVDFTVTSVDKSYSSVDDALNSMRWMIHGMTAKEEEKLMIYLEHNLVRENGRWKLPYRRVVRWAVLWWNRD